MRGDADPSEIQAIGIPAGLNCDVGMVLLMGMAAAGGFQKFQLGSFQLEHLALKAFGKESRPGAVSGVGILVHPLRIVEHGKEGDNPQVRAGMPTDQ